jgi:cation:H+ antiporter
VGTSLPELAATVASALRGHAEIAMGNVIGSNLFNLLVVMAMPGLLAPEQLPENFLVRDYGPCASPPCARRRVYVGRATRGKARHSYPRRGVGVLFCTGYALYYYWLFQTT